MKTGRKYTLWTNQRVNYFLIQLGWLVVRESILENGSSCNQVSTERHRQAHRSPTLRCVHIVHNVRNCRRNVVYTGLRPSGTFFTDFTKKRNFGLNSTAGIGEWGLRDVYCRSQCAQWCVRSSHSSYDGLGCCVLLQGEKTIYSDEIAAFSLHVVNIGSYDDAPHFVVRQAGRFTCLIRPVCIFRLVQGYKEERKY